MLFCASTISWVGRKRSFLRSFRLKGTQAAGPESQDCRRAQDRRQSRQVGNRERGGRGPSRVERGCGIPTCAPGDRRQRETRGGISCFLLDACRLSAARKAGWGGAKRWRAGGGHTVPAGLGGRTGRGEEACVASAGGRANCPSACSVRGASRGASSSTSSQGKGLPGAHPACGGRLDKITLLPTMKYVALLSGGKDSCFNLLHCRHNNHQLVAAATLSPHPGKGTSIPHKPPLLTCP